MTEQNGLPPEQLEALARTFAEKRSAEFWSRLSVAGYVKENGVTGRHYWDWNLIGEEARNEYRVMALLAYECAAELHVTALTAANLRATKAEEAERGLRGALEVCEAALTEFADEPVTTRVEITVWEEILLAAHRRARAALQERTS